MPALDSALETFLELYCQYSHQSCLRFFHYLLSAVKTRSPWFFDSIEQKKNRREPYQVNSMAVDVDDIRFVLGQKFTDNNGTVRRCVIIVQNPRVVKNRKFVQR